MTNKNCLQEVPEKLGLAMLVLVCVFSTGCHTIRKALGQEPGAEIRDPKIITSTPALGKAPEFNIATPEGYSRTVYHDLYSGPITISGDQNSGVLVFLKDAGFWFQLGPQYSGAYYYERPKRDQIVIKGKAGGHEYCLYVYNPIPENGIY